jgi:DNA-binding transcriptional ArsR family regulator
VLDLLAGGPRSVSDLAALLSVEHQLISKHLSELLRAGVVRRRQEGNFALYSLPDALTIKALALLTRTVAQERARLAELASNADARSDGRLS